MNLKLEKSHVILRNKTFGELIPKICLGIAFIMLLVVIVKVIKH